MIKKIILCCGLIFHLTACAQNNNSKSIDQYMNPDNNPEGLVFPDYPKDEQFTYILHVNSKTPYELYFDDILVRWDHEAGANESIELNRYILKNGTYKLRIRFLPRIGNLLLAPRDVVYDELRWKAFFVPIRKNWEAPLGYEDTIDYSKAELNIIAPPDSVPFWDQEFEVVVNQLPYELEGWTNGEDLTKLDQKELEEQVLAYYEKVRTLFNKGEIEEYYKLSNQQRKESAIYLYTTFDSYKKEFQEGVDNIASECKGNMLPLENYEMRIFGNARLVALMIPSGEDKHWPALQSRSEELGTTSSWRLTLYMPMGSHKLVPIR